MTVPLPQPLGDTLDQPDSIQESGVLLHIAAVLQRLLPRGKGAVPRWLGRLFAAEHRAYLVTRHGAKLVLSSRAYDVYASMRNHRNAWDHHDFLTCRNATGDESVFYDVGANVGYISLEMAGMLRPAGRVVAFEPQSELAAAIELSARLNGFHNLQVYDCLLGDYSGPSALFVAPASIHSSAVEDSGRPFLSRTPKAMAAIDDLVESDTIPLPDMIKIDVEGSEHLVLRGASRTLRGAHPHLFLEYFAEFDQGRRVRRELEMLEAAVPGYRIYGQPRMHLQADSGYRFVDLRDEQDWQKIHAVFVRDMDRPLASVEEFPP